MNEPLPIIPVFIDTNKCQSLINNQGYSVNQLDSRQSTEELLLEMAKAILDLNAISADQTIHIEHLTEEVMYLKSKIPGKKIRANFNMV